VPTNPTPVDLIGRWLQAEASYRKDNLGLFRGAGLDSESHDEVLSWDTGEQLANTAERRVWPLGLVAGEGHLFGFFPEYSSTSISSVKLRIWKFANPEEEGSIDEELTHYFENEEDHNNAIPTPLPKTLPSSLHPFSFGSSHMLPAQNQIFLTPGVTGGEGDVVITLLPYPQVSPLSFTGNDEFEVYQMRFNVHTRILDGPVNSTIYCDEGWRAAHVSVVKETMAQLHIGISGGWFADRSGNEWLWPEDSRAHRDWGTIMGGFAPDDYLAGGLEGPIGAALWSNNAPARRSDDPGHNWVYPFPTYHFDLWTWRLWQVQFSASDNGSPISAEAIQVQTVPEVGTPLAIESLLVVWDTYFASLAEPSEAVTPRSQSYSCLQEVGAEDLGTWYDCADGCFVHGWTTPAESGCTKYAIVWDSYPLGTFTNIVAWGGRTTEQKMNGSLLNPTQPGEREYRGISLPLPAGRPNLEPPTLARHRWMNFAEGIDFGQTYLLDPAVVFAEDGYTYQAITRSYPVYLPGQRITEYTANAPQPGGPERPEDPQLCTTVTSRGWAFCGGGPWEDPPDYAWGCNGNPWGCHTQVENEIGAYTLPETVVFGNFSTTTTYYHYPNTSDLSETCLVIGDPSGTSFQVIPISDSHAGATAVGPDSEDVIIAESLKVPENVWQIIPIPTADDLLLVLTDGRPGFEASPRPILQLRNRMTGALIATYTGLVPDAIQEQAYESHVYVGEEYPENIVIYEGEAKWHFHGRMIPDAESGRGFYVGEVPGPRMKATWPGDNEDGSSRDGDVYVHLSGELYEKLDPNATVSTFKSRTEYRCLKVTSSGFELVHSTFAERTNNLGVSDEHTAVFFHYHGLSKLAN